MLVAVGYGSRCQQGTFVSKLCFYRLYRKTKLAPAPTLSGHGQRNSGMAFALWAAAGENVSFCTLWHFSDINTKIIQQCESISLLQRGCDMRFFCPSPSNPEAPRCRVGLGAFAFLSALRAVAASYDFQAVVLLAATVTQDASLGTRGLLDSEDLFYKGSK